MHRSAPQAGYVTSIGEERSGPESNNGADSDVASTLRWQEGAPPKTGFSLSRKAVAAFMLDAIEQEKHFQKIVGIAN